MVGRCFEVKMLGSHFRATTNEFVRLFSFPESSQRGSFFLHLEEFLWSTFMFWQKRRRRMSSRGADQTGY